MADLSRHLFEGPVYAYVVLGIVEVVLAWMWYSRRTARFALALLPAPVLALAVGLTAHFVRTDREKIASALEVIAAAIEAGDVGSAGAFLDEDCRSPYRGGRLIDKEGLLAIARHALARWPVRDIRLGSLQTEVAGPNATTALETRITFGGQLGGQTFAMGWRLQWARRGEAWRIVRVEVTHPAFARDLNF